MTSDTLKKAYVLHTRPYRNTSCIVDFFTEEEGKVSAVVRGGRRPSSKKQGFLQPFVPLFIRWGGSPERLVTLFGIEPRAAAWRFSGRVLFSAFYMNELLWRLLTVHEPSVVLYQAYEQALQALQSGESEALVLRLFEKRFLQVLGYGLLLDREAVTDEPIEPHAHYRYEADLGPVRLPGTSMQGLLGEHLLAFHAEQLTSPDALQVAKMITNKQLSALTDRPFQTRSIYQAMVASDT